MATKTAQMERAEAKERYDAFLAACPSRKLLDRISDKWVCLVLAALTDGPLRFSELATTVAGVSQKMLTQTLRNLERDGLVVRTVTPSVPVRVDYELTELGESLCVRISVLKDWAETHMSEIELAQKRYDHRPDLSPS